MTQNIQKWGTYDLGAAKKEAEELAKSGSSAFFKPKNGDNKLRFLPPVVGSPSPFVLAHQHYVKMPGMANSASLNCPRVMGKRFCPVCAYAEKLRATGNPADYEQAGEFMAKLRIFALVIDRDNPDIGPQVFAYGKTIHEALIQLREAEDGGDFTHPIEGFDIFVNKTGAQKETRYTVRAARNSSPLGDLTILETMPDIRRYSRVPSDADVEKILNIKPTRGGSDRGSSVQGTVVESRKTTVNTGLTDVDDDVLAPTSHPALRRPEPVRSGRFSLEKR